MGGRGTFAKGNNVPYVYKTVGEIEGVPVSEGRNVAKGLVAWYLARKAGGNVRNFAAKQDGKRQGGGVCSRLFCGKRGNGLADVFLLYQILITLLFARAVRRCRRRHT